MTAPTDRPIILTASERQLIVAALRRERGLCHMYDCRRCRDIAELIGRLEARDGDD